MIIYLYTNIDTTCLFNPTFVRRKLVASGIGGDGHYGVFVVAGGTAKEL
jgi:hypothetical protein